MSLQYDHVVRLHDLCLESASNIVSDEPKGGEYKTNKEVRQLYLKRVAIIPELNKEWVKQGMSVLERAQAAWAIRHGTRLEARSMMTNPIDVELLRARDIAEYGSPDGPTFDFLVEHLKDSGLKENAVYEAIIEGSYRTNTQVDGSLGL